MSNSFKTNVSNQNLEMCALLLKQIGNHIEDGKFTGGYDTSKGWDFDKDDVQKNLNLVYTMLCNLYDDMIQSNPDEAKHVEDNRKWLNIKETS